MALFGLFGDTVDGCSKSQTNHLRLVVYLSIPLLTGLKNSMVFVDHKTWKTRSVNDSVFVFFGNPLLIYQKLD